MADLTITPANVLAGTGARIEHGKAGATITAGQVVYRDSADAKWKLADNNSATAAVRQARGIALNGAADGQPLAVHLGGPLAMGTVFTAGTVYYLSDTPGGICPVEDLASGEYVTPLGVATSTSVLEVNIQNSGAAIA